MPELLIKLIESIIYVDTSYPFKKSFYFVICHQINTDSRWAHWIHAVLLLFLSLIATSEGRFETESYSQGLSKYKYIAQLLPAIM